MRLNCIKEVFDTKGISQTWLVKRLGKRFNTVNTCLCNKTQPNLETFHQISLILRVEMTELLPKIIESNSK